MKHWYFPPFGLRSCASTKFQWFFFVALQIWRNRSRWSTLKSNVPGKWDQNTLNFLISPKLQLAARAIWRDNSVFNYWIDYPVNESLELWRIPFRFQHKKKILTSQIPGLMCLFSYEFANEALSQTSMACFNYSDRCTKIAIKIQTFFR